MTFDELNLIIQAIATGNLEMQDANRKMQDTNRRMEDVNRKMQDVNREIEAGQLEAVATNQELRLLASSIARGVQAMQDPLKREEEKVAESLRAEQVAARIARLDRVIETLAQLRTRAAQRSSQA